MEHVDIELEDGSILILTEAGEMLEMQVEPRGERVIEVMSSRPPSLVTVRGGDEHDETGLVAALEAMGHQVCANEAISSMPPSP